MLPHPGLPPFDYVRPETASECIRLLQEHGPDCRLLLGGTDLLVRMRDGAVRPRLVVDVKHLPGMQEIVYEPGRGLTVGAAVTLNRLAAHPDVRAHYSLLARLPPRVARLRSWYEATLSAARANKE
jgi:CO/xanthine dehydrogenase FAD-binding subunit